MIDLNSSNLGAINDPIELPEYEIAETQIGVVHFGPGAFHRAHQAAYFDKLLSIDKNYAICAISLHSQNVRDSLEPQDYLYTIAKLSQNPKFQIIGAIKEILVAPQNPRLVIERLANPKTKLVTSTITEKGYYLGADDRLDFGQSEIAFDVQNLDCPKSFYGFIVAGLLKRKANGLKPFTIIPCDNLSRNGSLIKKALLEFTEKAAPHILDYVKSVQCPCSMVDSITPATSYELRELVERKTGIKDNWPIEREEFLQWVIEEYQGQDAVPWRKIGVEVTKDIAQYEKAKLRILNGAHSSLAYFGILKGYKTVFEAMQDSTINKFVRGLIFEEIIPNLKADFDLNDYANSVLDRFANPAIAHQLRQIAWDGSKKIPVRILPTIFDASQNCKSFDKLCFALACWIAFIAQEAKANRDIIDPLGSQLSKIASGFRGTEGDIDVFIGNIDIFGESFSANEAVIAKIKSAYLQLIK